VSVQQFSSCCSQAKYVLQLANHVAQTCFFVTPLNRHVRMIKAGPLNSSASFEIYERLVRRAVLAMVLSTVLTAFITVLVFSKKFVKSTVILNIVDNLCVLGSIMMACNVRVESSARVDIRASTALRHDNQRQMSSSMLQPIADQFVPDSRMASLEAPSYGPSDMQVCTERQEH
jgi:hypothetical protein